ncbi:hypothetical protein ACFOLC_10210 [Lysobacter cavernae]|uniref:Uncharacterized protein n=1 Tax=Lysobacter cavernae TaxID=1685901 RepID=A0ABV7RRP4_9GAMM
MKTTVRTAFFALLTLSVLTLAACATKEPASEAAPAAEAAATGDASATPTP